MDPTIIVVLSLNCAEMKSCEVFYGSFKHTATNLIIEKIEKPRVIEILKEKS
jgi:hypothetical protein